MWAVKGICSEYLRLNGGQENPRQKQVLVITHGFTPLVATELTAPLWERSRLSSVQRPCDQMANSSSIIVQVCGGTATFRDIIPLLGAVVVQFGRSDRPLGEWEHAPPKTGPPQSGHVVPNQFPGELCIGGTQRLPTGRSETQRPHEASNGPGFPLAAQSHRRQSGIETPVALPGPPAAVRPFALVTG